MVNNKGSELGQVCVTVSHFHTDLVFVDNVCSSAKRKWKLYVVSYFQKQYARNQITHFYKTS
jgi:hypothetical protein